MQANTVFSKAAVAFIAGAALLHLGPQQAYAQCAPFNLSGSAEGGVTVSVPTNGHITLTNFPNNVTITFPSSPPVVLPAGQGIQISFPNGGEVITTGRSQQISISGQNIQKRMIMGTKTRRFRWERAN